MKPFYQENAVIKAEEEYLKIKNKKDKKGIAFSGGGIRSASFGLGVMQALVSNDKLKDMDYMSTVSGGGFLGTALTWALHQGGEKAGTSPEKFPLGEKGKGAKKSNDENGDDKNRLLNFVRQHGNYLFPTSGLDSVSFMAVVFRSIILSLFVYCGMLTVLMVILLKFNLLSTKGIFPFAGIQFNGPFIPTALLLLGLYLLLSFGYSFRTFFGSMGNLLNKYLNFIKGQQVIGILWKSAVALVLIGSIPYVHNCAGEVISLYSAGSSTIFGTLVGIWKYLKAQQNASDKGFLSDGIIYLGTFALIYGLLLLSYSIGLKYISPFGMISWPFFLSLGLTLLFGIFVDLNLIGPHRIWRDRLMEAFMPDKKAVEENDWQPAKKADKTLMEEVCGEKHSRPYHLINTNIILVDSNKIKYKNRGGDNFILSRLYCGSDATGWAPTTTFQKIGSRGMTLATAMATSAAALNPNAGVSGEGVTRNTVVSLLLSILNLRLGYWTTNPDPEAPDRAKKNIEHPTVSDRVSRAIKGLFHAVQKTSMPIPPNFFVPGLTSELSRTGLTQTRLNIQLSDGGHFENLALYELIRRKLSLIVLSDGGADAGFNFDDLANAVEKVRVDFGAKITFRDDYGLDKLLPKSAGKGRYIKKYGIAENGFAIADIVYDDDTEGLLVYIKLTMVRDLPTDVYSYKGIHPDFPHQSTADQFFDEKQFEAYRELGYYITWQMMESPVGKGYFLVESDK